MVSRWGPGNRIWILLEMLGFVGASTMVVLVLLYSLPFALFITLETVSIASAFIGHFAPLELEAKEERHGPR